MSLSEVQGQPRAIEAIKSALTKDAVPHAWLFQGPEGVGKELAALGLAQALMCTEKQEQPFGCGKCSACLRVAKRNHPDVTWVLPENEQVERGWAGRSDFDRVPSRDIRIEQVRALQERLALRALEGQFKVAILTPAHALNQPAQNALLKTLEEPPKNTVLLLVSAAPDKLLPTIRSRCARANFAPLPTKVIAELLKAKSKKIDPMLAEQVALMSAGSISKALSLDADALASRREVIEQFEALSPTDARGWIHFAEAFSGSRPDAEAALDVLQMWTRDVAAAQSGVDTLVNVDLLELAQKSAQRFSPGALQRRVQLIDETRNAITQRNGATRLQLEHLLIEVFAVAA